MNWFDLLLSRKLKYIPRIKLLFNYGYKAQKTVQKFRELFNFSSYLGRFVPAQRRQFQLSENIGDQKAQNISLTKSLVTE